MNEEERVRQESQEHLHIAKVYCVKKDKYVAVMRLKGLEFLCCVKGHTDRFHALRHAANLVYTFDQKRRSETWMAENLMPELDTIIREDAENA